MQTHALQLNKILNRNKNIFKCDETNIKSKQKTILETFVNLRKSYVRLL